jgi:glycosidase
MERTILITVVTMLVAALILFGCKQAAKTTEEKPEPFVSDVIHPEWSKDIVLYEINLRQYTEEGTIQAFEEHLPRLQELGVDVLWFMPVHPIGEENRKGELGSYYSVKDFKDINPEFGTLDDFKNMMNRAHEMGFYIMLDWVPNHTAWDNPLASEHPEYYMKDSTGSFIPPIGTDWTDVIQLDWTQEGLHDYMIEALSFWVELGVDGFRVDHPHKTPKEFWERARLALDEIKPVLMLAENEGQTYFLEKGFDMNYAWELHHIMNEVAQGKKNANAISKYFKKEENMFPSNVYRMRFLSNHDENSWAGTIEERMGDAHEAFAVFMFTMTGTPLIYNGQEECLSKRLEFFERDPIEWGECELTGFYKSLITLKKDNVALWNGEFGGPMQKIATSKEKRVFAFSREKDENKVVVFLNLSKGATRIKPKLADNEGEYRNIFSDEIVELPLKDSLNLEAWDYKVLIK